MKHTLKISAPPPAARSSFPDANAARLYLESRLWPEGVRCPNCRGGERITTRKRLGFYRCNACGDFDFTVRTGTIFERSKVPLHKWLRAIHLLATARISSPQLAKQIGITQKTAWFVLHRLREARTPALSSGKLVVDVDVDVIVDAVLAYKPKPKTKAAKRRIRRRQKRSLLGDPQTLTECA